MSSKQAGASAKSMKELDNLADRIRLHRQRDKSSPVLVEGLSDKLMLERAFGGVSAAYFIASTRSVAIDTALQLRSWEQDYYVCVIDRDFDDGLAAALTAKPQLRIHPYDNADLEAMLTIAGTASDLLQEMGSADKIAALGGPARVMAKLVSLVEPVATLRRASYENNWYLAFDKVDLTSKINKSNLVLNIQAYCAALDGTSESSPGQAELIAFASGAKVPTRSPICPRGTSPYFRGKDFLQILSAALCKFCGTKRAQSVEPDHLASVLRLAGREHLSKSDWGVEFLEMLSI